MTLNAQGELAGTGSAALRKMVQPSSVVLVGVSWDDTKVAGRPLKYLRRFGYNGKVALVNPTPGATEGVDHYRSIGDMPAAPDVALVALRSDRVVGAVRELAAAGVPAAIVLDGGFAEDGPEGAALQRDLVSAAGPMAILGPNCLGIVNLADGLALSPTDALDVPGLRPGVISVASQSGGVVSSMLSRAAARSLGLGTLVSTGNEAGVDVVDCIEYFVEDDGTKVIVLYLETIRRIDKFRRAAQLARDAGKPIVAYKVGRSEAGSRSVQSHTGALAGSARAFDALFRQEGIVRAERFSELLDIPMALALQPRPAGRRVAVLTTTGGAGTLIADSCGQAGFVLPSRPVAAASTAGIPPVVARALTHNPIDLTLRGLSSGAMASALTEVQASPWCDALVAVIGSSSLVRPDLTVDPVAAAGGGSAKPVLAYVSPYAPDLVRTLIRAGVPAFDSPEGAVRGLEALASGLPSAPAASSPVAPAAQPATSRLNEVASKEVFAGYGIESPARVVLATADDARRQVTWQSPTLVVKAISGQLAHKTEAGAVAVAVRPENVADCCQQIAAGLASGHPHVQVDGFLVEEMVEGLELILGTIRDSQVGQLILLGAGGAAAEVLDDVVLRLPPLSETEAAAMVSALRSARLLEGYRSRPVYDRAALVRAIVAFSRFVAEQGLKLVEAEINPLIVLPDGRGVRAADAVVVVRTDLGPASS